MYKNREILSGHHKAKKMEEKIRKQYHRRTRQLLEMKSVSRNLIKGLDTRAVPLGR